LDLSKLTDKQLIVNSKSLVKQESALLVTILHYIKEIDRRRLYADFKQPGLLELVMHELGYPRDQALRRIQAMRLLREIPQVELMMESGDLNLTHVGIVQSLFSHQKKEGRAYDQAEKISVLKKVAGQSTREAQKIVFALADTPLKFKERIKIVGEDAYEDHLWPKAKGGQYSLENLRLLCRSCNQRAAIKHYGVDKMAPHLGAD
jgi:hypothetical protein